MEPFYMKAPVVPAIFQGRSHSTQQRGVSRFRDHLVNALIRQQPIIESASALAVHAQLLAGQLHTLVPRRGSRNASTSYFTGTRNEDMHLMSIQDTIQCP